MILTTATRGLTAIFFAIVATLASQDVRANETLGIATSTSAVNSGLLGYLLPLYTETHDVRFEIFSVGSGQALRMGRRGEVDVVLTHAPNAEVEFVSSGFGIKRVPVMKNAFVIVGPSDDPAKVSTAGSIKEVLELISQSPERFVSRGDDSGTHKKERSLWHYFSKTPLGPDYFEVGLGMKPTLALTNEMQGYTLVDQATWLSLRSTLNLVVCYQSDEDLLKNVYSIIAINPSKHTAKTIQLDLALDFVQWLTSAPVQSLITSFEVDGTQLFKSIGEEVVE